MEVGTGGLVWKAPWMIPISEREDEALRHRIGQPLASDVRATPRRRRRWSGLRRACRWNQLWQRFSLSFHYLHEQEKKPISVHSQKSDNKWGESMTIRQKIILWTFSWKEKLSGFWTLWIFSPQRHHLHPLCRLQRLIRLEQQAGWDEHKETKAFFPPPVMAK